MGTIQIDGSTPKLTIGNATAEDATILFDGNAQDFYIALDDSADDLLIGLGSTVGTTPIISIDENKQSTFSGAVTVGVDDTGHDVKLFGATASRYWLWDESADGVVQRGTLTVGVDDTGHDVKLFGATASRYWLWDESADGVVQRGTLTVGVDDTGHDVKLFGASAGAYMEWDESADQLRIMGASADATTSTGKLLLATSLTNINANDVIGKIEFQAPHEAGGTDAITVAASIQAIAQSTFSASSNATDLIFNTGHSEAAAEKIRITSQNEIGIAGANYGTDGQVLTSGGAGAAVAWEDAGGFAVGDITGATALAAQPAETDEIVLSDAGTLKRLDIKHIQAVPMFCATSAGNQNPSDNTWTKHTFNAEVKDTASGFNLSDERWTPGVAGTYVIGCRLSADSDSGDLDNLGVKFQFNGATPEPPNHVYSGETDANGHEIVSCTIMEFDADDYVEMFVNINIGSGTPRTGQSWFWGYRITGL